VSAPVDADVKNFANAVVVPGYVDLGTELGIGGTVTGSIALSTKLGKQLYADDPAIKFARRNGVTTVLLGSMSSSNGTPLVAFKLGDDVRVIADPVAIRFRVGDNVATSIESLNKALQSGKAYHDSFIKYEKDLAAYNKRKAEEASAAKEAAEAKAKSEADKAKKPGNDDEKKQDENGDAKDGDKEKSTDKPVDEKKEKPAGEEGDNKDGDKDADDEKDDKLIDGDKTGESKKPVEKKEDAPPKEPKRNEALEPYRALFTGKIPALVEARKAPAIEQAVKLFVDEYKVRTVIVGADDLARFPNLLDGYQVGVCAGPEMTVTIDQQKTNLPQLLANERIKFGFQSKGTTGVGQLPDAIQYSVSKGLGVQDGLEALTSAPAQLLSDKMTFGSLSAGNDADLIVLSGPPFEHATQILAVMIDGAWVYDREEQK
jgi:imidazolonepropionase-like amidohydrolase